MDDKYLDNLITKAYHSKYDPAIPSEAFFTSIATRAIMKRRMRIFTRIAAAACIVLAGAGSLWFLNLRDNGAASAPSSYNHVYLESVSNVQQRIERLSAAQDEIRTSIDQQFPFSYTTAQ